MSGPLRDRCALFRADTVFARGHPLLADRRRFVAAVGEAGSGLPLALALAANLPTPGFEKADSATTVSLVWKR